MVASEALELEERVIQGLDGGTRRRSIFDEGTRALDECGDALESTLDVDLGPRLGGDDEGALGETDHALV